MLTLSGVRKTYHDGRTDVAVLRGIDLSVQRGESVALTGASGSGKSTLLHIAAGLETPDAGSVTLLGHDLAKLSERERVMLRRRHLGFVFQQFNLLPGLTARDNLLFQRRLNRLDDDLDDGGAWIERLVTALDLGDVMARRVEKLSGGEQQRVAIGRALAHRPAMVFADEPTGNLNDSLSDAISGLLHSLVDELGCAMLVVTHSRRLAQTMGRQAVLAGGRLDAGSARAD
ncbi:MAG: ABC transporter ATP-binding protein [Xanthomonadales bacterium]|nr:ABC transporter ATP-binding protein [Xanthomonadales bacterium]